MIKWIKCLFQGHALFHVRNIYGDEIIACGYKRSVWKCMKCGAYKWLPKLHDEEAAQQKEQAK